LYCSAVETPGIVFSFASGRHKRCRPAGLTRAFHRGSWGVGQDLRVLARPCGFDLDSITVPTSIQHADADTTVPLQHARRFAEAIPGAQLQIRPGHGHFSILDAPQQILATLAE